MAKIVILILIACLLAACAPSQQAIQTAIAETQTAIPTSTPTSTFTPSPTSIPTATINPCTDRGWTDIITYLNQYDLAEKNLVVGTSIAAYLQSLENYKNLISRATVDPCTEHARQSVMTGLDNRIYGMQLILTTGKFGVDASTAIVNGMKMIVDAQKELHGLGLNVTLP